MVCTTSRKRRRLCVPLPQICRQFDLPEPIAEYEFARETLGRKWRFDWAWPERRLALEEDGGLWQCGRHNRPEGYRRDMEKLNCAVELGWRVLRYETGYPDIAQLARILRHVEPQIVSRRDLAVALERACL